jgi:hypothetical protein
MLPESMTFGLLGGRPMKSVLKHPDIGVGHAVGQWNQYGIMSTSGHGEPGME